MKRISLRVFTFWFAAGLLVLTAGAALCGNEVNGVRLDTVRLNDDGSRTAVLVYEGTTYSVHVGESFPAESPQFQVQSMSDADVTLHPVAGGDDFVVSILKTP